MQRKTPQRTAIEQVFQQENRPLGIDEILSRGRQLVNSLNQATVYRTLKLLVDQGRVRSLSHPLLGTLYERTDREHHHHFHCHDCNRVYELPGCGLDQQTAAPAGYVVEAHEIFLFGLCPSCASGAK